jgi:hypothetical protein
MNIGDIFNLVLIDPLTNLFVALSVLLTTRAWRS